MLAVAVAGELHTPSISTSAISLGSSSFGGIFVSPPRSSALINKLSAGLPGTSTGPLSPPLSTPAFESRYKAAFSFSARRRQSGTRHSAR